jgi:hypothetical protein
MTARKREAINMTRRQIEARLAEINKPACFTALVGDDGFSPDDYLRTLGEILASSAWERANPALEREHQALLEQLVELQRAEDDLARARAKAGVP